jgi:hypothetical protein
MYRVFCAMTCLALASCTMPMEGGQVWEDEILGSSEEPITGGALVTDQNLAPYNSVVRINTNCTATKIGARKFITAAHCVGGWVVGGDIVMTNSLDGSSGTAAVTVTALDIHPTYELAGASYGDRGYDIAVFSIHRDTVIPAISALGFGHVTSGVGLTVGYGCDASDSGHDDRKQTQFFFPTSLQDYLDDGPGDESFKRGEYTFNLINRSDTVALCPGDSGGPNFRSTENGWAVAGVNSYYYGFPWSFQSRVGHVRRWVEQPGKNIFADESGGFVVGKSGFCLEANGGTVRQEYCDGRDQTLDPQFFTLKDHGTGYFSLINGASPAGDPQCLRASATSTALTMTSCNAFPSLGQWRFVDRGDGTVSIQNLQTRNCIQTSTGGESANPFQGACTPNRMSMRWAFSR